MLFLMVVFFASALWSDSHLPWSKANHSTPWTSSRLVSLSYQHALEWLRNLASLVLWTPKISLILCLQGRLPCLKLTWRVLARIWCLCLARLTTRSQNQYAWYALQCQLECSHYVYLWSVRWSTLKNKLLMICRSCLLPSWILYYIILYEELLLDFLSPNCFTK